MPRVGGSRSTPQALATPPSAARRGAARRAGLGAAVADEALAADGAGELLAQPLVDAARVEDVAAARQPPHLAPLAHLHQADCAVLRRRALLHQARRRQLHDLLERRAPAPARTTTRHDGPSPRQPAPRARESDRLARVAGVELEELLVGHVVGVELPAVHRGGGGRRRGGEPRVQLAQAPPAPRQLRRAQQRRVRAARASHVPLSLHQREPQARGTATPPVVLRIPIALALALALACALVLRRPRVGHTIRRLPARAARPPSLGGWA
eukprot:scaffold1825_cov262-Prasinococcus_capsulatus_cf.AAC.1